MGRRINSRISDAIAKRNKPALQEGTGTGIHKLVLGAILVVALVFRLKGIENPLLDDQAWRQADTASMALNMLGRLSDIPAVFFPYLNYDGRVPQRVELEFPFLPYLLAVTWSILGWADIWGRFWAVGFSLLAVWGIYDLSRQIFSERAGLIAAGIYAVLPLSVYYGRVVMPEPITQAFSIWALSLIQRKRGREQVLAFLGPALLMAAAILAKLPQLMLFPVAILLGFWPFNHKKVAGLFFYTLVALLPPMVYYIGVHIGVAADSQFVSGILSQQVAHNSVLDWETLFHHLRGGVSVGIPFLAVVGAARVFFLERSPARIALSVWLGISLLYITVVCVRISLDYYLLPVVPLISLLSGAALDMLDRVPGTIAGIIVISLVIYYSTWIIQPKYIWDARYLTQAVWLRENTLPNSVLVLSDGPPMTFYYAQRVGFRLIHSDDRQAFQDLGKIPGNFLVVLPKTAREESFLQQVRQSYPEVGPGVFRLQN